MGLDVTAISQSRGKSGRSNRGPLRLVLEPPREISMQMRPHFVFVRALNLFSLALLLAITQPLPEHRRHGIDHSRSKHSCIGTHR